MPSCQGAVVTNLDWVALAAVAARDEMALKCARLAEADVEVELGREIGSVVGGAMIWCSGSMAATDEVGDGRLCIGQSFEIAMRLAISAAQVVRDIAIIFGNGTINCNFRALESENTRRVLGCRFAMDCSLETSLIVQSIAMG